MSARWVVAAAVAFAACTGVQQRFPDDVQTAIAQASMRRMETARFVIYYPAPRRDEVERFLVRAERCADILRTEAVIREGTWAEKMVIVMPDIAFNNAFVLPELAGYEAVSVIPLHATLDFTTEFGLPPDPGYIACHELVHYVHEQQIAGFWRNANAVFGHIYNPQTGYDPWFFEGLATHYEAKLSPGVGRPTWPIFTGMFAAGYAGHHVGGGDMSALDRLSSVGHHYLVGTMFMKFLTERYGERPIWNAIASQAHALTGWFFTGTFSDGFGRSFSGLLREFDRWCAKTYPVRPRPAAQYRLAVAGNDARYARGRDGTEAWVGDDVDLPPRLTVRDPSGHVLIETSLIDVLPPRTLVQADPLVVSGMSITADGNEVWLTVIDQNATFQLPRLVRWRRGDTGVTEMASGLGPGATIDPQGNVYYYCAVDGDRWSLAAWDVKTGGRRVVITMRPGTYVLGAQISPNGKQLIANVWDGTAFVAWVIEDGIVIRKIAGAGTPIWDASFTSDGRAMWLGEIDGRFQVVVDGQRATDVPYAALAPREANGTIRFLDREGWYWNVDEVPLPAISVPVPGSDSDSDSDSASISDSDSDSAPAPAPAPVPVLADARYSHFDHFFYPQERAPTLILQSSGAPQLGFVLAGGDRLELQRWNLALYAQPTENHVGDHIHYGADFSYLNELAAPYQILGEVSLFDWADPVATSSPNVTLTEERRTRDASLAITRTWRSTLTASIAGLYTDDFDQVDAEPGLRRHLGGPQLALRWVSGESTRYTDLRRALLVNTAAAYYPRELSTFSGDITDLGGSLGVILPLPFGRRHTISASIRGRALVARDDTRLLQVGGDSGLATLWNGTSSSATPPSFDTTRFPPNLRFVEPLRGYEDYAITTDRAGLADVSWRYPLIIDRGVAATAWLLPASFLRELDFELFGAGAVDRAHDLHYAAGAAVTLRIQLLRLPLLITYQIARRLVDDEAITQLVGIAPDL